MPIINIIIISFSFKNQPLKVLSAHVFVKDYKMDMIIE